MVIDFKKLYIETFGEEKYLKKQKEKEEFESKIFILNGTRAGKPYYFRCYVNYIDSEYDSVKGNWLKVDNGSTGYEEAKLDNLLNTDKKTWIACSGNHIYDECIVDISNLKEVIKY